MLGQTVRLLLVIVTIAFLAAVAWASDPASGSSACNASPQIFEDTGFVQKILHLKENIRFRLEGSGQHDRLVSSGQKVFHQDVKGAWMPGMPFFPMESAAPGTSKEDKATLHDFFDLCKSGMLRLQSAWQAVGLHTWLVVLVGSIFKAEGQNVAAVEEVVLLLSGAACILFLAGLGGFLLVQRGLRGLLEQEGWRSAVEGMAPRYETLGFLCVVVGAQLGALGSAIAKLLGSVPLLQLMQARFLLQCACSVSACVVLRCSGLPIHILGQPGKRHLLAIRACSFSGALGFLWAALAYMPMGEVTAIVYFSPVVCAIMAYFFLGEELTYAFTIQAAVSCLGVLLVIGNPFDHSSSAASAGHANAHHASRFPGMGVCLAISSCFCFAAGNCVVRLLRDIHPLEVQVCQDLLTALVFLPGAIALTGGSQLANWSAWGPHEVFLLAAFTASGLAGSFALILGFGLAPVGQAAPFVYTELCTSFALQVCFFGEIPGHRKILGAILIIMAAVSRMCYEMQAAEPKDNESLETEEPRPVWERLVTPLPSPLQSEAYSR